ncbi:Outer membrane porin F precursor [Flavobacterium sp. ACN2]|uniref:OmpA family protein n=1 Tax=Flavobacterium sp. ACN2 TaxID=1975676 RepID=UPI000BB36029|nr:OmpA family protein [Flavobacterium sp. ACN2]PBI88417.1 Outer membrane porin F precursor [Flavobacterium sp. ACN2]
MRKHLPILLFLIISFTAKSQSYLGYFHDNYAGVQSVLFNPASIVDSRFKTDINLFSISGAVENDLYGVKLFDVYKDGYDFESQSKVSAKNANNGLANFDIMGPSFMFNIAPKHSLAVFTRARSVSNIRKINGYLIDQVKDGLDQSDSFNYNLGSPNAASHSWGELGISYAAVLFQKDQHFLKGGLTAKYLQGGVNAYVHGKNVNVAYIENSADPKEGSLISNGEVTVGGSQDWEANDDYKFDSKSRGFGFDFGLVYEWRPDYDQYDLKKAKPADNNFRDLNKYKLRFGLSVTDIGSINYKNSKVDTYNVNGVVTQQMIDDAEDLYDFLNEHYTKTSTSKGVKTNLPTAIRADADWNMYNKFYLNLNGDINLVSGSKLNGYGIADRVTLTPRYESRWFSFYLPMTYMEYSGMQAGAGLRAGVFFIGSGSILSNLASSNSKGADFHLGMKIPVYEKQFKDTDGDGVIDKEDACRKVAGPAENGGCPWPDTDKDGVFDKDDACIDVAGPKENKGCPWKDSDGDTLLDNVDACPTIAGPIENKGCPWPDTDGDGVLDKDDACPNEAGAAENKGCPELDADKDGVLDKDDACPTVAGPADNKGCPKVTKETLAQLKVEARSIFFTTGKATLNDAKKGETSGRLDAIKEILRNYPNAKFAINGHTDNVGNAKANQKLSEARAKVVMDLLIEKGVNPENLTSKGYGSTKPVKSNKTAAGRAENRRTEIVYLGNL